MRGRSKNIGGPGEIPGDEGLSHELAVGGDGDEILEAIGEAGEDLSDVGDPDFAADGGFTIGLEGLPESVTNQVAEGKIRIVLIVVFLDEQEAGGEAVAYFLTPRDAVGSREAFVDEIKGGEQEQGLVRSLVRSAFLQRRDADVEIIEAFDGSGEEHRDREAGRLIAG